MDDAHAVPAMERGLGEERAESGARLVLRHPVQVNLVAYGIFAAPQPAQDRFRDAVAAKGELVPGLDVEVVGVEGKRIRKDLRLVGAARRGTRLAALALRHPLRRIKRTDAAHGGAK